MAIPKALQAQIDEAERIQKAVYGQPEEPKAEEPPASEPEPKPEEQAEPTEAAPPENTNAEAQVSEAQGEEDRSKRRKPFERDDAEAWKSRYLSFQGVHRQTVAQLQQQIDDLSKKLEESLKKPEPKPEGTKPQKRVTEKDVEAYGSDLIDVIHRKALDAAEEIVDALKKDHATEVESLKSELAKAREELGHVVHNQAQTAEERFYSELDNRVSGWEEIQASDECQAWLESKVPGTRMTWDDVLKGSAQNFDSKAAVEVFQAFFSQYPQFNPNRKPESKSQERASELQRQVAPPKSTAAAPASVNGKKVYTSTEFEAESNRIIRLSKQGKYDEAAQIESELNAAMSEGRVRP